MKDNCMPQGLRVYGPLLVVALLARSAVASEAGSEPLHCRIDRAIEAARIGPPAPQAGDAEFLRRVSLDLAGMPPAVLELREFLADKTADKRARKIDRLLSSPHFARHWATTLDVMLMERRPNVNVADLEWQAYLLRAVQSNRPINQVMSELLSANGADPKLRAAARFFLDRGSEPNLITRDVGRIFFGRDMQCAQCHNHPLVKDYEQSDYYGLLAFISSGYAVTRKEGQKVVTFHAEKAGTDLTFDSVFVKNDKHVTGPRVPGEPELPESATPPGEEYQVKPAEGVIAVPKFSRRVKLASLATGGGNRAFNQNIANRLWAAMMGRGLVHPVDLHHPSNPPSHPELLNLLADELVATRFNVRTFLREIALTKVYQQAIDLPAGDAAFPPKLEAQLADVKARAEPLEASAEAARKEYLAAVKAWYRNEEALIPLLAEQDKARAQHGEAEKQKEATQKALSDAQTQRKTKEETARILAEAAARGQEVAKKLPTDKELLAAAAIFTKRGAAASSELVALEKTIAERTAALKKAGDDVTAAAQAVLAARGKVAPIREVVRQKEKIALLARRKMADARAVAELQLKRQTLLEAFARCQKLQQQVTDSGRASVAFGIALSAARKHCAELALAAAELSDLRASQFAQAQLKPLTPEQICFSVLKVTGVYDRYWKAEETELNKNQPPLVTEAFDPLHKITRVIELERRTYEKLKASVPPFVSIYAAAPGQPQNDFFATADQALFAANGGSINSWIAAAGGNVSERMIQEKDPCKAAEDLYMAILSRPPLSDESADVICMLTAKPKEKAAVVQELVWALLNSIEFRFNH